MSSRSRFEVDGHNRVPRGLGDSNAHRARELRGRCTELHHDGGVFGEWYEVAGFDHPDDRCSYSARSATIGLTDVARLTGSALAQRATTATSAVEATAVGQSVACTPNNWLS